MCAHLGTGRVDEVPALGEQLHDDLARHLRRHLQCSGAAGLCRRVTALCLNPPGRRCGGLGGRRRSSSVVTLSPSVILLLRT